MNRTTPACSSPCYPRFWRLAGRQAGCYRLEI
jgi:hypothetical protein